MMQIQKMMWLIKRTIYVGLINVFLSPGLAWESRHIEAELMLNNSPNVRRYMVLNASGHYFIRVQLAPNGQDGSSATVDWRMRSLPGGTYKLFVAAEYLKNNNISFTVTLKNSSNPNVPPFIFSFTTADGIWTRDQRVYQPIPSITTNYPYDSVKIQMINNNSTQALFLLDWLLITDDPEITIVDNPCTEESDPGFVRVSPPDLPIVIPVGTTNVFPNSSFETGEITWMGAYQSDYQLFSSMIDSTRAYHGRRSLRIDMFAERYAQRPGFNSGEWGNMVVSGFGLRPGRTYTFSFWVYHEQPSPLNVRLGVSIVNQQHPCPSYLPESSTGYFVTSGSWTHVKHTFSVDENLNNPIATVYFTIVATNGDAFSSFPVWIDAMQIHEGNTPLPYQPSQAVEAGVRFALPANMAYSGQENSHIRLYVHKASQVSSAYFEYEVYDIYDRLVSKGQIDLSALPLGSHDLPINLNHGRLGWFLLYYRTVVNGDTSTPFQRLSFSVIPPPNNYADSLIGGYGSTGLLPLQIYRYSNVRWQNLLSASNFICYWDIVESNNNDDWRLYPHRIQWAQQQGIQLIFPLTIGSAASSNVPSWAQQGTCASYCNSNCGYNPEIHFCHRVGGGDYEYFLKADWLDYVRMMVHTYKHHVKYWQVIDEPMSGFSPEEYVNLLRETYAVIKQEDPSAIVLASPHLRLHEILQVEPNLHLYCDGVYEYMRDRNYAYFVRLWAMLYRKRVVSVNYIFQRSGWYDLLLGVDYPSDIGVFARYPRDSLRTTALDALQSLCWSAAERYMLYDMRFPGALRKFTCFEADGSWKPAGAWVACANAILSDYVGIDELATGSDLRVFWFRSRRGPARSLFAVLTESEELRWIDVPGNFNFLALDAFGNPAEQYGRRVLIGGLPTYLIVSRSDEETLKRALIGQSLAKPKRGLTVLGTELRFWDGRLWLVTKIFNNTPWEFRGDAYVAPYWESDASLYHIFGYVPLYTRTWYATYAIQREVVIPANDVGEVWFALEAENDALVKNPQLNIFYRLVLWLVPRNGGTLGSNKLYTSVFWFQP